MSPIDAGRWKRLENLVATALELPLDERAAALDRACAGDATLLAEARSLLDVDEASIVRLEQPLAAPVAGLGALLDLGDEARAKVHEADPGLPAGTPIGAYRVLEELGRGGFGRVYLAERTDAAFEREVAIKVLRRGMDSAEIVARFDTERQILAHLEHPSIAALFDGGTTDDGRPYFVMEAVDGEPIDRACDARRLGIDDRLDLFAQVCDAVDAAHRKLVIHRDLKPSNVLVTRGGKPKLLDFGIAKLLDPQTLRSRAETAAHQRVLTPDFASPEQLRGEPLGTGTDVYSLGVLLHRLLTGLLPEARVSGRPEYGALRPSKLLERLAADAPHDAEAMATARSTTPRRAVRHLRGDLDRIVLQALEVDPAARYRSARALADDLRAYRTGQPVAATAGGLVYRARKWLARHRRLAAAAVLVGLGAGVFTNQYLDSQEEVRRERDRAQQVTEAMVEMFTQANPERANPPAGAAEHVDATIPVLTGVLARGLDQVDERLADDPAVQQALLTAIGRAYMGLGELDTADGLLARAEPLAAESVGASSGARIDALRARGEAAFRLGRHHEALEHFRLASTLLESRAPGSAAHLSASTDHALVLQTLERPRDAAPIFEQVIDRLRLLPGEELELAAALNNLAVLHQDLGDLDRAAELFAESLELKREALGPRHPRIALALNNLALLHTVRDDPERDDLATAERLYAETLDIAREVYGERHPHVAATLGNLGELRRRQGDLEQALTLLRESHSIRHEVMPADSPQLAHVGLRLAEVEADAGHVERALELAEDALRVFEQHQHPDLEKARIRVERFAAMSPRPDRPGRSSNGPSDRPSAPEGAMRDDGV